MFFISNCLFLATVHLTFYARCDTRFNRKGIDTTDYGEHIVEGYIKTARSGHLARLPQPDYGPVETPWDRLHFNVYTKAHPTGGEIQIHSKSLDTSIFDPSLPTVFVTHGWKPGRKCVECSTLRDGYLAGPVNVNVIVVDWSYFASKGYFSAISKINYVGNETTYLFHRLMSLGFIQPISTTLVGHSLGAHVMGVVGRNMKGAIGIIFGLDPAHPFISRKHNVVRISKECARHVQIIHTNGHELGIYEPLGHSDFYPNGGKTQKGCRLADDFEFGLCSHTRAWEYFAESLHTPLGFKARRCASGQRSLSKSCAGPIAFMGGYLYNTDLNGVYYLETHASYPYAMM